ncbi:MAG: DUF4175 family protein, partial [Pseudomonadota bacterium]
MTTPRLPGRTRRAIWLTFGGLWAEHLVRAFWPLCAVVLVALGLALVSDPRSWPIDITWIAAVFAVAGVLFGLWYAVRRFRLPRWVDATARVDRGMAGRPLQALQDAPATTGGDPAAQAVWDAHIARMRANAQAAEAQSPDLRVSDQDPFALRYVALLIALIGLLFGSAFAARTTLAPDAPAVAAGPAWEGWVRPPAYTRKPNVYLNDVVGKNIVVPQGSEVILRLYGDVGDLTVSETVSARTEVTQSVSANAQNFTIAQSGRLEVRGAGGAIWSITADPDRAPDVQLSARFERDDNDQIVQRFLAQDDYGVIKGRAFVSLHLDEVNRVHGLQIDPTPRGPIELQLPMAMSGDRTQFEGVLTEDLSKSPWVDLPVKIVLEVEDIRGQIGQSATVETML